MKIRFKRINIKDDGAKHFRPKLAFNPALLLTLLASLFHLHYE